MIDIGGGLGIRYRDETPPTHRGVRDACCCPRSREARRDACCSSRAASIVGNAGVLLTRVLYRKETRRPSSFVIVDAAMNDLIRPALYDSYHEIRPVDREPAARRSRRRSDVVGPICESGDFLAKDRELPRVEQGDLLAVMSAGAYGFAMASNYNTRPRAAEVLVDGDRYTIVRRRETYEDLVAGETHRMSQTFQGSFVAMVTPFRNGKVDEAKLRELVEFHVAQRHRRPDPVRDHRRVADPEPRRAPPRGRGRGGGGAQAASRSSRAPAPTPPRRRSTSPSTPSARARTARSS